MPFKQQQCAFSALPTIPNLAAPLPPRVAAAGRLQLNSVACLPANLLRPLPGAATTSLAAELQLLSSFPGPLGSSTNRDKV